MASVAGPWSGGLSRASSRRGAVNDATSPTHVRRHATPQSRAAHAAVVSAADLSICSPLRQIARSARPGRYPGLPRSEEHTSELQSHVNIVCRLLLEKK